MRRNGFDFVLIALHLDDRASGCCVCGNDHVAFAYQRERGFHFVVVVSVKVCLMQLRVRYDMTRVDPNPTNQEI